MLIGETASSGQRKPWVNEMQENVGLMTIHTVEDLATIALTPSLLVTVLERKPHICFLRVTFRE